MAKGPKYEFKIPSPGGLSARTPTKVRDHHPAEKKPTDKNQMAPDNAYPVPQRYRMGGGC